MRKYAVLAGVLVLAAVLVMGCGGASGAAVGDTVTVHYTGSLDDGTVFDSSEGRDPLTFVIGDGTMITGFDKAVRGMEVDEVKTVTIPAAEAYGEYDAELVIVLTWAELGKDAGIGDEVMLQNVDTGEIRYFTVIGVSDTEVTLDGNHELVGEDLTFEIEMVAIEKGVGGESAE
jgi:peptidylprolyl isomerase